MEGLDGVWGKVVLCIVLSRIGEYSIYLANVTYSIEASQPKKNKKKGTMPCLLD